MAAQAVGAFSHRLGVQNLSGGRRILKLDNNYVESLHSVCDEGEGPYFPVLSALASGFLFMEQQKVMTIRHQGRRCQW